jgi:molybdenum ABC transporter molybdate-binding protein
MRGTFAYAAFLVLTMSAQTARAEDVQLYAAGSLRGALTEVAKAFEADTGHRVTAKFGPSGALKDAIADGAKIDGAKIDGAKAEVFASANMEHPAALRDAHKSGPVYRFARNQLCALARPGLAVDSSSLLERLLDPAITLGTSTPKSDPSGDYAWTVFEKADAIKPGARATLEQKAQKLTGAPDSAVPPAGRAVYGWHIAEGRADIFLAYCTAAAEAKRQYPNQQIIALPPELAVGADYGLTVMTGASPAATQFAQFVLSPAGQRILTSFGFAPGQQRPGQQRGEAP